MNVSKSTKIILILFFTLLVLSVLYLVYKYYSSSKIEISESGNLLSFQGTVKKGKNVDGIKDYCPNELYIVLDKEVYQLKTDTKTNNTASVLYSNLRNSQVKISGKKQLVPVNCANEKSCDCDQGLLVKEVKVTKHANDNWPIFTGTIFCLEPNTTQETTVPCARGLITDDGKGYFLRDISRSRLNIGDRITLSGELEGLTTNSLFKSEGIINVFEIK